MLGLFTHGKVALISDIHANLEALEAVLAHIRAQGDVERIYCLGDVVGYGPDPGAVIDLVEQQCAWALMGNHDYAMFHSVEGFNAMATAAIQCQRKQLDPNAEESQPGIFVFPERKRRWEFLQTMPEKVEDGEDIFVHASPRDPIYEYLFPEDATCEPDKLKQVFDAVKRHCYVGHTHQPGVFTEEPRFRTPQDVGMAYAFRTQEKLIVNVGSVGQPRDGDPRACYATVSADGIRWYRVAYDVEKTIRKVKANPCLNDRCGLRLREGR